MGSSADAHLAGRLRLALAIGREQRAAALAAPERAHTVESCAGIAPLLSVGVITAPLNVWRRRRIRWARDVVMARADRCAVVLTFILGHPSMLSPAERRVVTSEQRVHKDLVLLDAHDGIGGAGVSHGGRAVAEKALAWFVHNANTTTASYVAKIDDDTMAHLPRLVAELRAVTASAPHPLRAYYGVHGYRLWDWAKQPTVGNAACGRHEEAGPPMPCTRLLTSLQKAVQPGGACAGSLGPFPFVDGSLEIIGRQALAETFGSERVRAFASEAFRRHSTPFWTHEDAGLGAMIHRESLSRHLPITYIALRRWDHNRPWINWADKTTLLDGDVQWAHYTRSAERADYAAGVFAATASLPADALQCGPCLKMWGWAAPVEASQCCSKPRAKRRGAHSARALRQIWAHDAPLNFSCSLDPPASGVAGSTGVRYVLGVLSRSHHTDERYEMRRLLASDAADVGSQQVQTRGRGGVHSCFVFDATPPHGGVRQPDQLFNNRAWLMYEAGRHADMDMQALTVHGNFPRVARPQTRQRARVRPNPTAEASARWWNGAAAHARGHSAADYYALLPISSLLAMKGADASLGVPKQAWVPRATVAAGHGDAAHSGLP